VESNQITCTYPIVRFSYSYSRFYHFSGHLTSEQLASTHVMDEKDELTRALRAENDKFRARLDYVEQQLWEIITNALASKGKVNVPVESAEDKGDSQQNVLMPTLNTVTTSSEGSTDLPSNQPWRRLPALSQGRTDPHPPGFCTLTSQLNKFSGRCAEVWLQDYVEATKDCGWDDEKHAKWFSWGPAKAT